MSHAGDGQSFRSDGFLQGPDTGKVVTVTNPQETVGRTEYSARYLDSGFGSSQVQLQ